MGLSYLTLEDARGALTLVGQCHEIASAGGAAAEHMLAGLGRLAGAEVMLWVEGIMQADRPPVAVKAIELGWASQSDRVKVWEYMSSLCCCDDPLLSELMRRGPGIATVSWDDIGASAWRTSATRSVHRASGLGDSLVSAAIGERGAIAGVVLKRALTGPAFGERQRALLDVLHAEVGRFCAAPVAPALSRRQNDTLQLLRTGASEKQIAAALGLSPHTVHEHVTAVYRRFGVKSRAELMARFLSSREHTRH
jgi:DNA-binding CsgD family transcriptional regulator